jgi:4-hydroxy-3-polyprenylbenzoate decarboxylase
MGFGGKMCIDGTGKLPEERDDRFDRTVFTPDVNAAALQAAYPEVKGVNTALLQMDIPCLIVAVEKSRRNHVRELHPRLAAEQGMEGIKMILYVEHTVDPQDLPSALWRFCNNLDPKRDNILTERPSGKAPHLVTACLGLDGTIKTKVHDDFQRDWPNIIVADDATIKKIDEKWSALNLGPFIPSPSLKYKQQIYGDGAVVAL